MDSNDCILHSHWVLDGTIRFNNLGLFTLSITGIWGYIILCWGGSVSILCITGFQKHLAFTHNIHNTQKQPQPPSHDHQK